MNVGSTYSSMAAYVMAGPCGCGGVIEGKERVLRTPKWVSGWTFMVVEHIIRIGRTVSGPVSRLTLPRGSGVGHVRLRRRAERAEYNGEGCFSWTRTTTGLLLPCLLPRTSWLSISSTTCCRCKVSRTQSSHNRQQQQPLQLLPPLPRALLKPPIIHNSCSNSRSNSPSFNSFNSFKARYFNNRFFSICPFLFNYSLSESDCPYQWSIASCFYRRLYKTPVSSI